MPDNGRPPTPPRLSGEEFNARRDWLLQVVPLVTSVCYARALDDLAGLARLQAQLLELGVLIEFRPRPASAGEGTNAT